MGKMVVKSIGKWMAVLLFVSVVLIACSKTGSQNEAGNSNDTGEVYEYKWMSRNPPDQDGTITQVYMEEKFNIKVVPVRAFGDAQKINLMLSSGDIPDLMVIDDPAQVIEYVGNDILAEIPVELIKKHMPNYYDIIMKLEPQAFENANVEGKNYTLPKATFDTTPLPVNVRSDWLKNTGSDIPVTLEQLEQLFVKFRNDDPDRNGKKDTYALSMPSDVPRSWFQSIFGAFGTQPFIWHNRDGKLVYGFTESETKEALKLLKKWKDMDLIDPEFIVDKDRTNGNDDVIYKFASGRIGYLDNASFQDNQWDNDGRLNAKWVANSPEWQQFFENPENANVTSTFTAIPASGPQPVYVSMDPPTGPDGKSGSFKDNMVGRYIVFGKQLEQDEGKLIKLLSIVESITSDEETYVNVQVGPENVAWVWNEDKQRVYKEGWLESELYVPQGRSAGVGQFFGVTFGTNPDMATAFGGPRVVQRYEKTWEFLKDRPAIENALKAPLPSASEYVELDTMIKEYIVKAILGEVDIDATFDDTVKKWTDNGGDVLTKEANDWYNSVN